MSKPPTKPQNAFAKRDWLLVAIATVMIVCGLAIVILILPFVFTDLPMAILVGFAGVSPIISGITSIVTGNRAWILIDLILPG